MTERARLAKWRDELRDSDLDTVAKAVGFVIATYFDRNGHGAFPAKATIADGVGARSVRTVDRAVIRLERAGFLTVSRSKGRSSNRYAATIPTPYDVTGSTPYLDAGLNEVNPAFDDTQPRLSTPLTPYPVTGESAESAESVITRASRAGRKKTSRAQSALSEGMDLSAYDR